MKESPMTFITENKDLWFQSIIPNGCTIGGASSQPGGSYVQYFIKEIDHNVHYEIFFFDEKCQECYPQLKRYEVGKVYVELHVEVPTGKKWMEKNRDFLALLNAKFLLLNKIYNDSFVKEWGDTENEDDKEKGFSFRLNEGFNYDRCDKQKMKGYITEQLEELSRICDPVIHEAWWHAKYPQWFSDGEMIIDVVTNYLSSRSTSKADAVVMLNGMAISNLLADKNITIPSYQRRYCWVRKQVEHLLESIWFFPWGEKDKLHLGTIVLHERIDSNGDLHYDVVDGQQRLITLSMLYRLMKVKFIDQKDEGVELAYSLLRSVKVNEDFKRHVYFNAHCIIDWLNVHVKCKKEYLTNIQVDVIVVKGNNRLGLAYTFFDAINSAGKKLTDYDLLKPHHLRYFANGDPKGYFASWWDHFVQEKVSTFGGAKVNLSDELLDCNLYRLRSWSRNRPVSFERHHVFNHFEALSSIVNSPSLFRSKFEVDCGISGGKEFFLYVVELAGKYKDFTSTSAVVELHNFLASWRHVVLLNIIRALLFLYYCKFGDVYLCDALIFIVERVGRIRANSDRIVAKKVLRDSLVTHTVAALDESPTPEIFFGYCVLPTNQYEHDGIEDSCQTHIKPAFWRGVKMMFKALRDQLAFRSNQRIFEITEIYKSISE